jgi:membrane-associated phospholipid phosphatase
MKLKYWFIPLTSMGLVVASLVRRHWWTRLFTGLLVFAIGYPLNIHLRQWIREPRPNNHHWLAPLIQRGQGQGKQFNHHTYGMPSFHAQVVGFCIGMAAANHLGYWVIGATCLFAVLTMAERWMDQFHTLLQLAVGLCIGLALGGLSAILADLILNHMNININIKTLLH